MTKPAPAAVRSTLILDELASRPAQAFTLSEIAEAIEVNAASTLALLKALCEAGYVVRHPRHKTYALGPAVLALGHAATVRHAVAEVARREIEILAEELGTACTAGMIAGRDVVIVGASGRSRSGISLRIGDRIPLAAPSGAVFMAWAPEEGIREWLARTRRHVDDDLLAQIHETLGAIRRRGYVIAFEHGPAERFYRLLQSTTTKHRDGAFRKEMDEILGMILDSFGDQTELRDEQNVIFMAAPVFDGDAQVQLDISVHGFGRPLGAEEIQSVGNRLRAAATHVTTSTYGLSGTAT